MRKAIHKVKENRLSSNSPGAFCRRINCERACRSERIVETAVRLADAEGPEADIHARAGSKA
jgi:hypothetical protein